MLPHKLPAHLWTVQLGAAWQPVLEDRPPYGVGDWKRGPVTSPPVVSSFPVSSGLPRWLSGRESACQCRRHRRLGFDPWVGKIPLSREGQSTPIFLPEKSHGQRSLVGYSYKRVEHDWETEHAHANTWSLGVKRCSECWLSCPCNLLSHHRPLSARHLTTGTVWQQEQPLLLASLAPGSSLPILLLPEIPKQSLKGPPRTVGLWGWWDTCAIACFPGMVLNLNSDIFRLPWWLKR